MGKALYDEFPVAREHFALADKILGYSLSEVMFDGTEEELKKTDITQPAVFLHSYISYLCWGNDVRPDMVAGHSLGEYTALAVNGALAFDDALRLVENRAVAMQEACRTAPSGMAVVLKFDADTIEKVCNSITDETVVAANFNSPLQTVISGSLPGLEKAAQLLKEAGAKHVKMLNVGGAFHSPLMQPAQEELAKAIHRCAFHVPACPIYQNVSATPSSDPDIIKENLLRQLTAPVLWTQTVQNMIADGANNFVEFGPGETLQNLIKRIDTSVAASSCGEVKPA